MATLTETAYYTRRGINWSILAVIAYIILRIFWGMVVAVWLMVFPPKPPPPNHAFNKLPALQFPTPKASPSAGLTFKLETIQGTVPRASSSAYVFFMPKAAANLLAITKTQEFARKLRFNPTPIPETKNIYQFNDADLPLRKLRYDIISNNFMIKYNFEQDTGIFGSTFTSSGDAIQYETRALLQTYNIYPDDLVKGNINTTYLKLVGDQLVPITNVSQANAMKADVFRRPIASMFVYTPDPSEGQISVIYSPSQDQKKRIVKLAYTFWPVDYKTYATYGLKTSQQAWLELQSGAGYIARYPSQGNTAVIRNVTLGYYDSFEPQTYLQPIFVFEGDHEFLAYVPAVAPPWTE